MEKNTYNGWTNYETWLVKLWLDNEPGQDEYWIDEARDAMSEAVANENSAESLRDEARATLAERIQSEHEHYVDEILPSPASFLNDLVNSSMGRVNWHEIASHYVDEIPVYCVGWNMPGYMPDSEPAMFLNFDDAQESLKESFERHYEDDETISEEQLEEILDGIDSWKDSSGEWGFNFGQYFYWIVRQ